MSRPVRDRYLFSADRKVTEYRDVLEITPGHARLVTPSAAARGLRWVGSVVLFFVWFSYAGILFVILTTELVSPWLAGWPGLLLAGLGWIVGFFLLFLWWDRRSLPLLADSPASATELILAGARSFGTYQDVRARNIRGEEIHLIVDARAPRFWKAVKLLEGPPAPAR